MILFNLPTSREIDMTEPKPLRGMLDDDQQLVEINNRFGYSWSGKPFLKVGDVVVLPTSKNDGEWVGVVTNLGSSWDGQFKAVKRLAALEDIEKHEHRLIKQEEFRRKPPTDRDIEQALRRGPKGPK